MLLVRFRRALSDVCVPKLSLASLLWFNSCLESLVVVVVELRKCQFTGEPRWCVCQGLGLSSMSKPFWFKPFWLKFFLARATCFCCSLWQCLFFAVSFGRRTTPRDCHGDSQRMAGPGQRSCRWFQVAVRQPISSRRHIEVVGRQLGVRRNNVPEDALRIQTQLWDLRV